MKRTLLILVLVASVMSLHAQQQHDPNSDIKIDSPDTNKVFVAVQQEPAFPGGKQKWADYLKENLKYPSQAKENSIQGRVFVQFVVERDGVISNPKVVRGIGSGCDEEAIRLMKASPKWDPGLQNGHAVRVQYMVPIDFRL